MRSPNSDWENQIKKNEGDEWVVERQTQRPSSNEVKKQTNCTFSEVVEEKMEPAIVSTLY